MAGAKKKYIEAACELLEREGLAGVSTRKVADELGCTSAALYRHFPDIDKLIAVASIRFLRDYIEDARLLSKVDLNPMELNLQLWECLAYYSFRNAAVFENMFYGDPTGRLYSEAVTEYFTHFPEDLMGLK
ncbi:MAG: TetR/AcrR family transcriptional regulator, partial [Eggerthellaceae bacterium]|nr:TetR/AcrR family transcriptional regulator [Eggerthellaceae bacterium]